VSGPRPSTIRGISAVVLAGAPILLAQALSEGVRCALDRLALQQSQVVTCERQIRR
jgi:hypothetical protein